MQHFEVKRHWQDWLRIGLALIFLGVWFQPTQLYAAATLHVDGATGNDNNNCGAEAAPCKTLQFAANRASSGDTLLVAGSPSGIVYTYTGVGDICSGLLGTTAVLCFNDKQLTWIGGYASGNWASPNPQTNLTIIDGQNSRRGVIVLNSARGDNFAMDGFIIKNGRGGGVPRWPGDQQIFAFGGGMLVDNAHNVVLKNMSFQNNQAIGGDSSGAYGGVGSGGGLALRAVPNAALQNLVFANNEARGGSGRDRGGYAIGGGLYTFSSVINGVQLTFTNNRAIGGNSSGDGVAADGQRADALGGGAAFQIGSTATLQKVGASGNQAIGGNATTNSGGAFGGGLYGEGATVSVTDGNLHDNIAQGGKATNGWLGSGGGFFALDTVVTLNRVKVLNNLAQGGSGTSGNKGAAGGGGINVGRSTGNAKGSLTLLNAIVTDNRVAMGGGVNTTGGGGGGLWLQAIDAKIDYSTIARNQTDLSMLGQGLLLIEAAGQGANATISNSIVAEHTNQGANVVALHVRPASTVTLNHNLFSRNGKDTNADGAPAPAGQFNGLNNLIPGAVAFVAPGAPAYDYHLQRGSAAINQATGQATPVDIDNEPRNDGKPDLGADEYTAPPVPPLAFTTTTVTKQMIAVAWQLDSDLASQVQKYVVVIVEERAGNTVVGKNQRIDAGSATNYTLRDVTPYHLFMVQVEALNAAGGVVARTDVKAFLPSDLLLHLPIIGR